MKPVENKPSTKQIDDLRGDVPTAAAVPSKCLPAMSYILSRIPLLKSSPVPFEMNPTTKVINDSRSDVLANYFPSRVPAKIRNKIYEFVLQDSMASTHKNTFDRSLSTCRRLYSVNRQVHSEFANMVPLIVHLDRVPATLPIFFPPRCLSGHFSHGDHATRTTEVHIILPIRIQGPRDLTDILRTRYYARDLSIKFSVKLEYFCSDIQESFSICRLFNKVFGDPPAALLAPFKSEVVKSITFIPPPYCRRNESFIWALGLRRSPGWLGKKNRDLVLGCLAYLQQESAAYLVKVRVCASVQDKKGLLWGEWVGCEESRKLMRQY